MRNELRESVPETWAEELWELQGRVKAMKGYLDYEVRKAKLDGVVPSVDIGIIEAVMGFNHGSKEE